MLIRQAANIVSQAGTGNLIIPANRDRSHFAIFMTSLSGTIKLGKGDGAIPLSNDSWYEPSVCPTGEIEITTTGTYVIVMG